MKRRFSTLLILQSLLVFCVAEDFVATKEWQEIKEGQKVPAGLHYRINLETGKKEAKILEEEKVSTSPVLSDQNQPEEEIQVLSPERVKEMQEIMDKMKMNKDIDNIKTLMANFENATLEQKGVILEDLDYYLHQIDNAQDFVSLNGVGRVILPSLRSLEDSEEVVAKGAILLGSSAQANIKVQNSIIKTEVPKELLEHFLNPKVSSELFRRLIFAMSALTRGNANSVTKFKTLGAFKILQRSLEERIEDQNLVLKGLSMVADLSSNQETKEALALDESWCHLLKSESLYQKDQDLDHTERLVNALNSLQTEVCTSIVTVGHVQKWLKSSRYTLWKSQDDSADFKVTIEHINKLLATLKDEL